MTALHPAGSDREGQSRKYLWPPPDGSGDPILDDREPLLKMLMEITATQDGMLEDHLLLVNRVGLHSCSDYCLRTPRHLSQDCNQGNTYVVWNLEASFVQGRNCRVAQKL